MERNDAEMDGSSDDKTEYIEGKYGLDDGRVWAVNEFSKYHVVIKYW